MELSHLACGNLGKLYGKLKVESDLCPPWDKLKEAEFWKRADLYQRMWDVLIGTVNRPTASIQGPVETDSGSVKTATFDLDQDGKTVQKIAAWGSVEALSAHRRIHLWLVEVGSDGLPPHVPGLVEHHKDSYLIIIGPEMGVWKCQSQLGQLKDVNPILWRYKTTTLNVYMRDDQPLGSRIPPHVNVIRRVLIASPHAFKPHRLYLATDYPWRVSILTSLIAILDVPPKNVFLTMLYIPHAARPQADVLGKMGQALSQLAVFIQPGDGQHGPGHHGHPEDHRPEFLFLQGPVQLRATDSAEGLLSEQHEHPGRDKEGQSEAASG